MGKSSRLARPVPRFMDLCSGLGIDSTIFVDVDALLLELLIEPRCQWLQHQAGGQPLVFFAALGKLLADLQSCQDLSAGRLRGLAFTEQGAAWNQPPIRLLRLSVTSFLSVYGVPVHTVPSWHSPDFERVLRHFNTAFILTSDIWESQVCLGVEQQDLLAIGGCLAAQAAYGSASGQWNSAFLSNLEVVDGRAFGFRTLSLKPSAEHMKRAINFAEAALQKTTGMAGSGHTPMSISLGAAACTASPVLGQVLAGGIYALSSYEKSKNAF